jgi:hypothetical protein
VRAGISVHLANLAAEGFASDPRFCRQSVRALVQADAALASPVATGDAGALRARAQLRRWTGLLAPAVHWDDFCTVALPKALRRAGIDAMDPAGEGLAQRAARQRTAALAQARERLDDPRAAAEALELLAWCAKEQATSGTAPGAVAAADGPVPPSPGFGALLARLTRSDRLLRLLQAEPAPGD